VVLVSDDDSVHCDLLALDHLANLFTVLSCKALVRKTLHCVSRRASYVWIESRAHSYYCLLCHANVTINSTDFAGFSVHDICQSQLYIDRVVAHGFEMGPNGTLRYYSIHACDL